MLGVSIIMDKDLIRKYLEGQCSPEEITIVEKYLSEEQEDFTAFREVLEHNWDETTADQGDPVLKEALLQELHGTLFRAKSVRWMWYSAAAVVIGILLTGTLLWTQRWPGGSKTETVPVLAWKTLVNESNHQKTALLPDGTRIWLNPGAELSYHMDQVRDIRLKGEVFFNVAQDAGRPFRVYTDKLCTQVLGTAFNIEAYPKEHDIRVSLVSGKIAVQGDVLQPGQMFIYKTTDGTKHKKSLALTAMRDWTSGYIVFNDVPLKDALERIAARYGLSIVYAEGVDFSDKKFTSVFSNETPDEMLQLLLFVSDSHFRRKGNVVEILP